MLRTAASIVIFFAVSLPFIGERSAQAQGTAGTGLPEGAIDNYGPAGPAMPADYAQPVEPELDGPPPPIPPYVDGPAVQISGGGYCFEGAHPVDNRVETGVTWDPATGRHTHNYPPFDLRLFSFQNGCYYFIGDPSDFGYAGDTYSYYGAHPILANYGGGWCFMIGPHRHFWRPWSPLFVTVGPWYYWEGPYDPFFWTYWPFYHFYYRSHYPHYYHHGAFFRGHVVAPRITSVPRPPRFGGAGHGAGGSYRAAPNGPRGFSPAPQMQRATPGAPRSVAPAPNMYRVTPAAPSGSFGPRGGFAPHNYSAPSPRSSGGGSHFGGGSRGGGGARFRR
jgi:hypothetical protein